MSTAADNLYLNEALGTKSADGANAALGAKADAAASSDTGTYSLIALVKRLCQCVTTLITGLGTATLTNVAASATNVTLLAANASRKRLIIANDGAAILYIKFGSTASSTSWTVKLYPNETYESPPFWVYSGQIDGIWSSVLGTARITEM